MPQKVDPLRNHIAAVDVTNFFSLSPLDKEAIILELSLIYISLSDEQANALFRDIESEITCFLGEMKYTDSKPKKSEIKTALLVVSEASKIMLEEFSAMNSVAQDYLADYLSIGADQFNYKWDCETRTSVQKPRSIESTINLLEQINADIESALKNTENIPGAKGGRKKSYDTKIRFGAGLASVLRKNLPNEVKITATHGKLFETMLTICIEAATGEIVENAHRLALDSLKMEKKLKEQRDTIVQP